MKKFLFFLFLVLIIGFIYLKRQKVYPVKEPVKINLTYYLGIEVNAKNCVVILDEDDEKINFDFNIQIPSLYNVKKIETGFSHKVKKISNLSYEIKIPSSPFVLNYETTGILKKNRKKFFFKKQGEIIFLKPVHLKEIPIKIVKHLGLNSYPSIEKAIEKNIEYEKLRQVEEHIRFYEPVKKFYPVSKNFKNFFLVDNIPLYKFNHDEFFRKNYKENLIYIAIRKELLYKISVLKKILEEKFFPGRIEILCGFRSPNYNQGLIFGIKPRLKVFFSRHQWGGAIDFIIDNDKDGIMDDLNGDFVIDIKDAYILKKLAEEAEEKSGIQGGIGAYSHHDVPFRVQTPYVHMDTRGWKVRWKVE